MGRLRENLATELAPLIVRFEGQPTKQYLGEYLMVEDEIIFAMAPMGVLTAVVSVIRMCRSHSP